MMKDIDSSPERTEQAPSLPILFFFGSALLWLSAGLVLILLASWQSLDPHAWLAFGNVPWLTFGRVYPAALDALVYGWLSMGGAGAAIWILGRLTRAAVMPGALPYLAVFTWNVGLALGVIAILAGGSTGMEWFEFPLYSAILILLAQIFLALWVWAIARRRTDKEPFISVHYFLAAFTWFPWFYSTAVGMLLVFRVSGVAQPAVQWWCAGCLFALWLTPLAIGILYYLIPLMSGRSLYSRQLAKIGFWGIVILGAWPGLTSVLGGPFPAWMLTASIVAKVLLVIPILAVVANLFLTLGETQGPLRSNLAYRFAFLALLLMGVSCIWDAINATRSINLVTQFTWVTTARTYLTVLGFLSSVLFAALYFFVPRMLGKKWYLTGFVRFHFWLFLVGLGVALLGLTMGGVIQGLALLDPKVPFVGIIDLLGPFLLSGFVGILIYVAAGFVGVGSFLAVMANPAWLKDQQELPEPVLAIEEEVLA